MSRFKTKSKQALIIVLALLLFFAMVPSSLPGGLAYADEITYTNSSANRDVEGFPNNYGPVISSDKASYYKGENIYIKVENSSSATSGGWIGIYEAAGAKPETTTKCWAYTGSSTVVDVTDYVIYGPDRNAGVTVNSELGYGTYYIILMASDGRWAVLPIEIKSDATIALDKEGTVPQYKYGEPVLVTAQCSDESAWVGVFDYSPDFPDGYYARFDVKDVTGSVDLVQLAAEAGKPLAYGKSYRAYICVNQGGDPNHWVSQVKFELLETYGDPTWSWDESFNATATFTSKSSEDTKDVAATVTSVVTKEATEEEEGLKTYTATVTADDITFATENDPPFTDTKTEVIPKLSHVHTVTLVPAVEATCAGPGNIAYYECSGCHKYFEDADATVEIEDKTSVVIPAEPHAWGEWVFDETTKTHSRVCANDPEHTESGACTFDEGVPGTDSITYTCTVCGGSYTQITVPVITTDKTSYKFGEDIKVTTELNGNDGDTSGGWIALQYKGESYSLGSLLWYYPARFDNPKTLQSIFTPVNTGWENVNGGRGTDKWTDIPAGEYEVVFLRGNYERVGQPAYFTVYYEYNDPTWTWAEDGSSATATFAANGNAEATETATATNTDITKTEKTAATCTEAGIDTYTASVTVDFATVSGETTFSNSKDFASAPLGHSFGEWTVVTPATEEAEGLERRECTRCDAFEERAIPVLSHTHNMVSHPAVEATCIAAGNSAYYECQGCGKFFSDEAGEHEIENNSWIIPKNDNHDYGPWVFDEATKTHTKTCSRDASHKVTENCTFEHVINGNTATHTCAVCGGSYTTALLETDKAVYSMADPIMVTATGSGKDWVGLFKKGATPGGSAISYYYYYVTDHNGEPFNILNGVYQAQLAPGEYTLYLLENDGYNVLASVDITLEHQCSLAVDKTKYAYGDPIMVSATSDYPGAWVGLYDYYNSDPLDETLLSYYNLSESNGEPVDIWNGAIVKDKDKLEGLPAGKYKVILFTAGYDIDLIDGRLAIRSFDIEDKYTGPTWSWNNNLSAATATFTAQHNAEDIKTVDAVVTSVVTKEATESEDGLRTYTATVESVDFATVGTAPFTDTKEEVIPKLSHVHTCTAVAAKDPTCTEAGNTAYYECSGCHKFFEDAEGTKEITDKDSVVIAALGHAWGDWTFDEATKTHTRVCANDPTHVETGACTFTHAPSSDPDLELYTCTVCGGQYEVSTVPIITTDKEAYKVGEDITVTTVTNGHTEGWVALYAKGDPYLTSMMWYYPHVNGYEEKVLQTIDGKTDITNQNLGTFSWADGPLPEGEYELVYVTYPENPYVRVGQPTYFTVYKGIKSEEVTKEPTCTEPGTKHIIYEDDTTDDVEIEALGHDPKTEWVHDSEKRTHYHECSRCGERLSEAACTFDEGKVTKEATAKEEGEMLYTCTVCGGIYTEVIPTLADQGVKRVYGDTRFQTALLQANELKEFLGVEKFDSIIVATGTNYADALSGAYLGYVKAAPILLVQNSKGDVVADVNDYIKNNIKSGGTVYLLGGEAVVTGDVTKGLDVTTKRLYGDTRYETNIEILKEAGVGNKEIMVCDGTGFADSLSASAAKLPILLVKRELNDTQRKYLSTLPGNDFYLVGGTGVLPTTLENELKSNYGSVERLGGADRYETSTKVAEKFFKNPEKAIVAYAMNYPDGLCGGTLAAYMNAPLLLVRDDKTAVTIKYTKANGVKSGMVLGGSTLVSDKSVRDIFEMKDTDEIYVVNKMTPMTK